jgi:hypothetical protein
MRLFGKKAAKPTPSKGEIAEARQWPNGWVYRISSHFDPNGRVPPEAIVGAWNVDADGRIVGDFIPNEKYDAECRPGD